MKKSILYILLILTAAITQAQTPRVYKMNFDTIVTTGPLKTPALRLGTNFNTNTYTDRWTVYGNSITVGQNSTLAGAARVYSYVNMVSSRIEADVTNYAIAGTTLVQHSTGDSSGTERLIRITPTYTSVQRAWVSMIGINDEYDVGGALDTALFRSSYNAVLTRLKTTSSWPANKIYIGIPFNANSKNLMMNNLIKNIALVNGVNFVAVRDSMLAYGGTALIDPADGIHLTNQGHFIMGRAIANTISGNHYAFSMINHDLFVGGALRGTKLYTNEIRAINNYNSLGTVKLFDNFSLEVGNITSPLTGARVTPQYMALNSYYSGTDLTGAKLSYYVYTQTGMGISTGDGLYFNSIGGPDNRITFRGASVRFKLNNLYMNEGIGAVTTPGFFDFGVAAYANAPATYANAILKFYTGTFIGVSNTDGFTFGSSVGTSSRITFQQPLYFKGSTSGTTGFNVAATTANYVNVLPATAPTAGQVMVASGSNTTANTWVLPSVQLRLTGSGNGSSTTISIAHGLTGITAASIANVDAINLASAGISYITTDATNVNITYATAPASGTNNLSYNVSIRP